MNNYSAALRFGLALVCFLAVSIALPAVLFGVLQRWQVIFLLLGYLVFFLGTVWRVIKYGKLAKTKEDGQYQHQVGVWILVVQLFGFLGVHWLGIYEFSRFDAVSRINLDIWLTMGGIIIFFMAVIINQAAIRTLKGFFDRMTLKPDHKLITSGIYSQIRHPVYLSYILLFTSYCTILKGVLALVLMAGVCSVWLGNRIAIEEKMLQERFGDKYKAYQQRTKKLFPLIY